MIGIYSIRNIVNGHQYIGSSKRISNRWYQHLYSLRRGTHNPHLQNAFNKHSEENFQLLILEECSEEDLLFREQYYIDFLKPEYNNSSIAGKVEMTPEIRKKLSIAQLELCKDPKEIEFRSNKAKEQWKTPGIMDGVIEKLHAGVATKRQELKSKGLPADFLTPEQHIAIGEKNKGRKNTSESCKQMSESHKGIPWSDKQREGQAKSWTNERHIQQSTTAKIHYASLTPEEKRIRALKQAAKRYGKTLEDYL